MLASLSSFLPVFTPEVVDDAVRQACILNQAVIPIDPYTLVTVDEGYSAITTDNGKMVVLAGGQTYLVSPQPRFQAFYL